MSRFRPLRPAFLAIALLAVSVVASAGAVGPVPPSFAPPVEVPSSSGYGEPSIAVGPEGNLYVVAPGSSTQMWRSTDGGAHFAPAATTGQGSGDSDVTVDADGIVYASDLFTDVPVSVSSNQGGSFQLHVKTTNGGSNDRQWTVAHGHGNVWSQWRDGSSLKVAISHDGGKSYGAPIDATDGVVHEGKIVATSDLDLYIPYTDNGNGDFHLAASHNGGLNWTTSSVARSNGTEMIFPGVAVDAGNNVYVVWAIAQFGAGTVGNGPDWNRVYLAVSHDDGQTFDDPLVLSNDNRYNVFPWILADATGHVMVTWLEGAYPLDLPLVIDPNLADLVQWHVTVAYSTDADTASPTFTDVAATGVMHTGPICYLGGACFPLGAGNPLFMDRSLLDFYQMAEKADGSVAIAYPADASSLVITGSGTNLWTVRQVGGGLLR